jgi:hypothetical protein
MSSVTYFHLFFSFFAFFFFLVALGFARQVLVLLEPLHQPFFVMDTF